MVRQTKSDLYAVNSGSGAMVHLMKPNADRTFCNRGSLNFQVPSPGIEILGCKQCIQKAIFEGYTHAVETDGEKVQIRRPDRNW